MRKFIFITIVFYGLSFNILYAQSTRTAWYIAETVDSILTYGRYKRAFYPIQGFETDEKGQLWVLVTSGELSVIHKNVKKLNQKDKTDWHEMENFCSLFNLSAWSKDQQELYLNSKVFFQVEGDDIHVRFITSKGVEEYRYTSLIGGISRFSTILEMKGYLFDFMK